MRPSDAEFKEIAHSGGKITFGFRTNENAERSYCIGFSGNRPVPMVMAGIYALPQGFPVCEARFGGIGQPMTPPQPPGCLTVFICSDSTGHFGHNCPGCGGYWRSGPSPRVCPYCRIESAGHNFLSHAQLRYVKYYCDLLLESLHSDSDDEVVIDMDAVADAVDSGADKPAFYVSEESQQRQFNCGSCGEFNDILGRFGYCSSCGTRNDLEEFIENTLASIRTRLRSGDAPEDCLRGAVSGFDSYVAQFAKELARLVPMTKQRRERLLKRRFHDLTETMTVLKEWFDIDICKNVANEKYDKARKMFFRRHLYEHNGGEVDQKYIEESGDSQVRLKQLLRESTEDVHDLISILSKVAQNVHDGFHEIITPREDAIQRFREEKERVSRLSKRT